MHLSDGGIQPHSREFERLMNALGIEASYTHVAGHEVAIPGIARRHLAFALGYSADNEKEVAESLARFDEEQWDRCIPAVLVLREDATNPTCPLVLRSGFDQATVTVSVMAENGDRRRLAFAVDALELTEVTRRNGSAWERRLLPLPYLPPPGYHRLEISGPELEAHVPLIVTPVRAHLPEEWNRGGGDGLGWGLAVQLYGLRSQRNRGYGDLTDLSHLAGISHLLGAATLGINPLHALFPGQPSRCSPYSPLSRLFLNPLYIDVEAVPEFATCVEARELAATAGSRDRLAKARAAAMIDPAAIAALKEPVLAALWAHFRDSVLAQNGDRAAAFRRFVAEGGERLEDFGRFLAMSEVLGTSAQGNWRSWPAAYHDPRADEVARFADGHRDRVDFHLYLQWLAEEQLAGAAGVATAMPLGLYRDMAVGFDRDGFDAWVFANTVPEEIAVGCPPDIRNPLGQNWGVCAFAPRLLKEAAYAPWIELLRANMRHAGMLRIDHAFQLARLFWIPLGRPATEGGYLRYPMDDLIGILALESRRNRCVVVAEDLGTFPEGFRTKMAEAGGLSFRLLHRERTPDRDYLAPETYPRQAVVVAGTHDHATLSGFWSGRDVEVRTALNLYPNAHAAAEAKSQRPDDRRRLLDALARQSGFDGPIEDTDGKPSPELVLAVHRYLAATPSCLVLVQIEDLLGQPDQMNVPGTVDEYPNWLRRGLVDIEDLALDQRIQALAALLRDAGRSAPSENGKGAICMK